MTEPLTIDHGDPVTLDPSRDARPRRPHRLRMINGVPVRFVEHLPDPDDYVLNWTVSN